MNLSSVTPILRIFDEAKAREFYIDFLGFAADWEHRYGEEYPIYMGISRDACIIHLTEHHGDATPGAAIRVKTDDVRAYNQELLDKAYKYAKPGVEEQPWDTLEMTVTDPFGNRLTFYEVVD